VIRIRLAERPLPVLPTEPQNVVLHPLEAKKLDSMRAAESKIVTENKLREDYDRVLFGASEGFVPRSNDDTAA
jgi:hypothetical protein